MLAIVPLGCDKPPVPAQDRVRGYDGRQLHQRPAPESLCFDGRNPSLVVGEEDALAAHLIDEDPDLGVLELDDLLLLAVDPARAYQEEKLPGTEDDVHRA